jgi:excisionase family DNA binding protein
MHTDSFPPKNENEIEKHYGVDETAKLLGVHPATVRRLIYKSEIPAVRIGTRLVIARSQIRAYLAKHAA